jgi:uncharacterized protein (TIGR03435 family)
MIPQSFSGVAGSLADFGPALANHLWQSTVFVVVAGMLTLALRKNHARARYWIWMAASVKFLVPFALLITIGSHLVKPREAAATQAGMVVAMEDVSEPFALPDMPVVAAPVAAVDWAAVLPVSCGVVWLGGFVAVLCLWYVRWRRIAAEMRESVAMREGRELEALLRLERASGIGARIRLLQSPSAMEPGVFGIARPVLAWPSRISERLDDAHLVAVLAHEVCHVRRRDNLTAAMHMVVEAAFWFYPLVWWLGARLVEERERACDEEVLELCKQPEVYAESILKVCEFCVESPLACVSGVTGADLKQRIVEIMTERVVRKLGPGRKLLLVAVGLAVVAAPIVLGQAKGTRRMAFAALKSAAALQPLTPAPAVHAPPSQSIPTAPIEISRVSAAPVVPTQTIAPIAPIAPAAASAPASAAAPAATPTDDPTHGMKFDVVSIKLNKTGMMYRLSNGGGSEIFPADGDSMTLNNWTLEEILKFDYAIHREPGLVGLPAWASKDRYDIQAKVGESDVAAWRKFSAGSRRLVLRALLADSFKLKVHTEDKNLPIYALVIAKKGPKNMQEVKPADLDPDLARGVESGNILGGWKSGPNPWVAHQMWMGYLVFWLNQQNLGRPVYNQTGLNGYYNFTLQFAPMQTSASANAAAESDTAAGPSIFTALQEQLGLKLKPTKGPVPVMVVDHVERPTEN